MVSGEFPPQHGGLGDYTNLLCQHLATLGMEVGVVTSKAAGEMARGKGNRIFGTPTGKGAEPEKLVAVATLAEGQKLIVWCGDRSMTLTWKELQEYRGERAQRGAVLSRNYRKVDRLEVTGG